MNEQLALAEAPPAVRSPWEWAREKWPGKLIVRVIDQLSKRQGFVVIAEENGFMVDGATHFIHSPFGGLTFAEKEALEAEYDAAWWADPDGTRR